MKYLVSFNTDWNFEVRVFDLSLNGYLNSVESSFLMDREKLPSLLAQLENLVVTVKDHYYGQMVAKKDGKVFEPCDTKHITAFLLEVIKMIKEGQQEAEENGFILPLVRAKYSNWAFSLDLANWRTV